MTAIEPLKPRNTTAPVPLPAQPPRSMSELVEQAGLLAQAGDAVPKHYRGSAGACLLAIDLAQRMDRPILWVLQNVAFINGRQIIEGNGIIDIAAENDYSIELVEVDNEHAKVALVDQRTGEIAGEWTSTMADENPRNPIWNTHPQHMLRSNAIRNVWKFWGKPRGGYFMVSDDEIVEAVVVDPVEVLAPQEPEAVNLLGEPDPANGFPEWISIDEAGLKAAITAAGYKQADVLKKWPGKTLGDIVADNALCEEVMTFLEGPA